MGALSQMKCRSRLVATGVAVVLLLAGETADGAYLRNVPQIVSQPDGTVVHCFASGDEHYNWLHDASGYVIVRDPESGLLVYAGKVDGRLTPTDFVVGRADPTTLPLERNVKPEPQYLRDRYGSFRPGLSARSLAAPAQAPAFTAINNIVVFIRFSDETEFTDAIGAYEEAMNSTAAGTNSIYSYFREASYQQLSITSTFYPAPASGYVVSYQDSQPRAYYEPYDATTNPDGYQDHERGQREHILLGNAVSAVAGQVPGSLDVDLNNDGYVDNVSFIIFGPPTGWNQLLWPHRWYMSSDFPVQVYINSKLVDVYNFLLQDTMTVGTLCHELTHTLGAPDLYRYETCSSDATFDPVGKWDLMASNLDPPQHSTAYMKMRYMGWLSSIPEITSSGTYTLNPITSPTNNAYKIASPYSASQYFVVEYRRKAGFFEAGLPTQGLVVYRIDTAGDGAGNRCGPPDELYVYRPYGTTTNNGDLNYAPLSSESGQTAINDSTEPSCFLADGSPGGLNISDVGAAGGDTMSFTVTYGGSCDDPGSFSLTSPSAGATLTGVASADLTWSASATADSYDVYFGTSTNPPLIDNQTVTSRNVAVATGNTYHWKVVAKNSCGQTAAPASGTWSFSVETASGTAVVFSDDFEGSFPGQWQVSPWLGTAWGGSTYRSAGGSGSAWCAGGGSDPQPAGSAYASSMGTWMKYGPFSLADAAEATVEFDLWLESETDYDYVWWTASTDGTNFWGSNASGDTDGWTHKVFNLHDIQSIDVIGQEQVWLAFYFQSDDSTELEGAYIDNVVLSRSSPCPAPPPSPTMSAPSTASSGASYTVTWTATSPTSSYEIEEAINSAFTSATRTSVGGTTRSFSHTVGSTTAYYYRVRALDSCAGSTLESSWSNTAQTTVQSSCTAPDITTHPADQTITSGSSATLTVTASGSAPLTYQWYQGTSGDTSHPVGTNSSLYSTAALTTTTGFWVQVLNSCGQANSSTATVTVIAPYAYLVPSVAHWPGKNNTAWRTNLAGANLNASSASLTLTYTSYETGATTEIRNATLAAGESVEWQDVLVSLFGYSASDKAKGSIHIASTVPVFITSRTYNQTTDGTFGQYYPAIPSTEGFTNGQTGTVMQLKKSNDFRSNLGVQNLGTSGVGVQVKLFNASGVQVGSTLIKSIAGNAYFQWDDVFAKAGAAAEPLAYATVEVQTPGSRVWAYGSVVDNETGDPTTVPVLLQQ